MPGWARLIHDGALDALIFPEIGMNDITLGLASLRLCPYQLAAWGHPETSGLPTIDGFLSADRLEPPEAQEHYCERLLRLPNLGVHYEPHHVPSSPVDFTSLGLRGGPLFVCAGVPFKYAPQHDRIFVEIARRLGPSRFLFFEHDKFELSRRLSAEDLQVIPGSRSRPDPAPRPDALAVTRVFFRVIGRGRRLSRHDWIFGVQHVDAGDRVPAALRHIRRPISSRPIRQRDLRHLGLDELVATSVDGYIDMATRLAQSSYLPHGDWARLSSQRQRPIAI